ncbi:4-coumarate-CoA ligase 2 [Cordyceps fumosorosea ARSEF 2679]|uniref:4-coumarate-CoA ligase 2 n=1 Tax=Cordyceps fumosorosea (strain ARSEF 2679) TaxID=1081104 RepID=A0A168E364_CORFA|nr:4-coumarate-CoA ligase 2 [Cordyceps fumosorosea ARSEF 2679]OAA73321.1 4-coumarate-CoA ligase 2 [Cordyceps fumosorosea ARSEF 2679]
MLFKSAYPDIEVPSDVTLWQWLFEGPSPAAGCSSQPALTVPSSPRAYINTQTGATLTHAQVRDAAAALSAALLRRISPGDVVAVISPNAATYPVCVHGVIRAGGVPAVTSPAGSEAELRHALRTVRARLVMCAPEVLPVVRAAARAEGLGEGRVVVFADGDDRVEGLVSLSQLVEEGRRSGEVPPAVGLPRGRTSAEETAFLCFSSGTTGLPKAPHGPWSPALLPQQVPRTSVYPQNSPFIRALVHCLVSHTSIAVVPRFTMPALLSAISTHRIAEVNLVPPILIRLAQEPAAALAAYDLSCVERWATGAAPVSPEVLARLARRFPGTGFKQGYGMTETTACVSTHPPHLYDFKHGRSVGTLVAGTVVRVVDEDGVAVGVGQRGEIRVKGPQIFPGYLHDPESTAAAFDEDGFLRTGDEGSVAADGQITIHDRIKEMIKVKGAQVAPAELEDLLLGHPRVADAAVIGVPDDYAGERPFAFVALRPGGTDSGKAEEELMGYVRGARARSKWLVGVRVVEAIPKSPSGKILRRVLREQYKREAAQAPSAKL